MSWRYGLLGLPLAFVALPLYVSLPAHYAREHGMALGTLGGLLLGARLVDASLDPLIGRGCDRWLRPGRVGPVLGGAALLMLLAFAALFFPPDRVGIELVMWAGLMLVLGYTAYSVLGISHQAWGARLGGGPLQQTQVVAWREGMALAGVLLASVLITQAGWAVTTAVLALALALGVWSLLSSPLPESAPERAFAASCASARQKPSPPWSLPWRTPAFRRLLLVHAVNGVAAAIPATVLLFFVRDRLQQPQWEAGFLLAYFAAAAVSLPLWLRVVARTGQLQAWLLGMGLAVLSFVWAATLGPGDGLAFAAICVATGVAAGADLSIPPALLTRVLQQAGLAGRAEGAFFGWWNAVNKLNLALAAGLALPLLQLLGYQEGVRSVASLQALGGVYALLPCGLKLVAMLLLWALWLRPAARPFPMESLR